MLLRDFSLQDLDAKKIRMTDEEMANGGGSHVEIDEDLHSRQVKRTNFRMLGRWACAFWLHFLFQPGLHLPYISSAACCLRQRVHAAHGHGRCPDHRFERSGLRNW